MSKVGNVPALALILVLIGLGSLVAVFGLNIYYFRASQNFAYPTQYGMMNQYNQQLTTQVQSDSPRTIEQAESVAQRYLQSTGNPNLAIKEIMEFQYNFYVIYYEKNTGRGAFEMLIWKQTPRYGMMGGGMMRGYAEGIIMPELGLNMMWNSRYGPMANGIMGYLGQESSTMTVPETKAQQLAQAYLNANFQNGKTEMATEFYGYYTFDFTINGKIAGMLSVNGYSGQVWYHSWHGDFIQEVEFD
jgi:hypothetical protein